MGKLWVVGFFLFFTFANTNLTFACFEHERGTLLRFKRSLKSDPAGPVSSWNGNDCCNWQGVGCDNATGYVTSLDLGYPYIYGVGMELNVSVAELTRLTQLRFLNLSAMGFSGSIPHFIGNLSNLRVLDLSHNPLVVDDFTWFSSLLSLKHLDLTGLNIVTAPNLDKALLSMISSLRVLHLRLCMLKNSHFYRTHLEPNLTLSPIQTLVLTQNQLEGEFPLFLQNLTALQFLDVSYNELNSTIPFMSSVLDLNLEENSFLLFQDTGVWRLCRLKRLDLSHNSMEGGFTGRTTNVSECAQFDLETLNLNNNMLGGEIPTSLGRLTALRELNLGSNKFTGTIPEALGNLTRLRELDLSMNKLTGSIPTSIGKLLLLQDLDLSGNKLTTQHNCSSLFPLWIRNLSELRSLDISDNLLQGSLPTIGGLSKLDYLDISNNYISGVLDEAYFANTSSMLTHLDASLNYRLSLKISPDWEPHFQLTNLQLGSCKIESEFPRWIRTQTRLEFLYLSNTSIFGPLPDWLDELPIIRLDLSHNFLIGSLTNLPSKKPTPRVYYANPSMVRIPRTLLLKNNFFGGPIPDSFCNITNLEVLDLSRNMLFGNLPECFGNFQDLTVLILSSNRLSGAIPSSLGNLGSRLLWLSLNNNSFHGEFPKTLANCSELYVLDLGENRFFGSLPKWIAENNKVIHNLRLHTNNFTGQVPVEWCKSYEFRILDLGGNKLTGIIPRCFSNLSGMTAGSPITYLPLDFENSLSQVMKESFLSTLRH